MAFIVLEVAERFVSLAWRRSGAALREIPISGSRIWYAEFQPVEGDPRDLQDPPLARSPRAPKPPPTLVLLHGLGTSSVSFQPVIHDLRRVYRVIAPDLPGHGHSRPPEGKDFLMFPGQVAVMEKFLAQVAPNGAYVAGNSMGGWIAAKLAARRPDLVRGLALLNPGGPALRAEDWVDFARIMLAEEHGAMAEWLSRCFHNPPLALRFLAHDIRRMMRRPSVTLLMASLRSEDFLSDREMRRIRCPAMLVWGERDRLIPDGCRSFFLEKVKGIRYEPLPDCGHCPQLECPHRTADILLELPALGARGRSPRVPAAGGRMVSAVAPRARGGVNAVARAPKT